MDSWRAAAVVAFALVAIWRAFAAIALALATDPPALALVSVAGQAAAAGFAALAIARRRAAGARLALAAFVACVVVQMGADALVYGFRSLLEALSGVLAAGALAALGWLALRGGEPRVARTL